MILRVRFFKESKKWGARFHIFFKKELVFWSFSIRGGLCYTLSGILIKNGQIWSANFSNKTETPKHGIGFGPIGLGDPSIESWGLWPILWSSQCKWKTWQKIQVQVVLTTFGTWEMRWNIHPLKQTWNLKIPHWKRRNIYKPSIFGFHVCFRGCIPSRKSHWILSDLEFCHEIHRSLPYRFHQISTSTNFNCKFGWQVHLPVKGSSW